MIKLFVVLASMAGVGFLLSTALPASHKVAFTLLSFGITWMMIACLGTGIVAYKVVK